MKTSRSFAVALMVVMGSCGSSPDGVCRRDADCGPNETCVEYLSTGELACHRKCNTDFDCVGPATCNAYPAKVAAIDAYLRVCD